MFNKPALFPKATEPQPGRAPRIGPGSLGPSGTGPVQSVSAAPAGVPAPREPMAAPSAPAASASQAGAESAAAAQASGSRLIVGPDVKLKGAEILDCDTLVVEGRVEATMDSRVIRIAENGSFSGTVVIDVAEVFGCFEGELTARGQLVIHATGRVTGKIRYGKILIEEGGELSGDIQSLAAMPREQGRIVPERAVEHHEAPVKVA